MDPNKILIQRSPILTSPRHGPSVSPGKPDVPTLSPGRNAVAAASAGKSTISPISPGKHAVPEVSRGKQATAKHQQLSPGRADQGKTLRAEEQVKDEEMIVVVPKKWLVVRKNVQRILDYGRKENLISDNDDNNQNNTDNSNNNQNNTNDKENDKKDEDVIKVLTEDVSMAHSAIPFLPVPVAIFCLILNVCLPGIGTICSGFATICVGQPRLGYTEGRVFMSIVINFLVGIAQLITITFMFVGWFWSIAWGGLLLMHSLEYRTALMQKRQEAVATAAIEALTKDAILRKRDVQNLVQTNKQDKGRRKSSLVKTLENKLKRKTHKDEHHA